MGEAPSVSEVQILGVMALDNRVEKTGELRYKYQVQILAPKERSGAGGRGMTVYGYARVSTDGQTLDAQIDQLHSAGVQDRHLFAEKQSGAKANRPALAKALKTLGNGDVLLFTKMDRLARNTRDLLNILDDLSTKGAKFKCLDNPLIDTTTPHGTLITQVLASIAEFERKQILERTSLGRTRAMAKGIKFGRKPKLDAYQVREAKERRENGELLADIARSYKVSRQTIARL